MDSKENISPPPHFVTPMIKIHLWKSESEIDTKIHLENNIMLRPILSMPTKMVSIELISVIATNPSRKDWSEVVV